jgi:hypothetical protein
MPLLKKLIERGGHAASGHRSEPPAVRIRYGFQ